MDPLSMYRMSVMPGLGPKSLASSPEDMIAKIIPKDEMDKLSSSTLTPNVGAPQGPIGPSAVGGTSFQSVLGNMVNEVSAKQAEAGAAMRDVVAGGSTPLHQAMISVEEASVSFQLMVEVRNKLLESYQELMRMQV
jgi:flagellar hook-basal body complex protein FliE